MAGFPLKRPSERIQTAFGKTAAGRTICLIKREKYGIFVLSVSIRQGGKGSLKTAETAFRLPEKSFRQAMPQPRRKQPRCKRQGQQDPSLHV
ncbi:hypothetical protein HMPREF9120_01476 [Neisseria sp. oral taxon 020 str. F0370]|nr:hypothetical protein HMPREF9120_01476 [Neisseria sp. oral taxon 020 str. F0370]